MNHKDNKGAQRTRASIKSAFLDLAETTELRQISVRQLTDACQISRGTFYLHYSDVFDLASTMESEILDQLESELSKRGGEAAQADGFPMLQYAFEYVKSHQQETHVFLGSQGSADFRERLRQLIERYCLVGVGGLYGSMDERAESLFAPYAAAGILEVVRVWVRDGCDIPCAELAQLAGTMTLRGAEGFST